MITADQLVAHTVTRLRNLSYLDGYGGVPDSDDDFSAATLAQEKALIGEIERLQCREYVMAQHDETGRYWSGPREDIPQRFTEVPERAEGGPAPEPPSPMADKCRVDSDRRHVGRNKISAAWPQEESKVSNPQGSPEELANARLDIVAYQRDARACPEVFAVVVRSDGDNSVSSLYATREAAEIECAWHNKRSSYYGRAHIEVYNVLTEELARRRWK